MPCGLEFTVGSTCRFSVQSGLGHQVTLNIRMPARVPGSTTMNEKTRNRVWKWSLIDLFGVAALTVAAGGCWL